MLEVLLQDRPDPDVHADLLQLGHLRRFERGLRFPEKLDRERNIADFAQPTDATMNLVANRTQFVDLLKDIAGWAWNQYNLPRAGIVEYGPGASGFFYNHMRPNDVSDWLQVEINPANVEANKANSPNGAQIMLGDYYDISFRGVPMIVGLSSFDTAMFMPQAMEQVAEALAVGGYFFHIQDVRPGIGTVAAHCQRKYHEIPTTFYAFDGNITSNTGLVDVQGKPVSTIELFRESLTEGIQGTGRMKLLEERQYVLARGPRGSTKADHYYFNIAMQTTPAQYKTTQVLATVAQKVK